MNLSARAIVLLLVAVSICRGQQAESPPRAPSGAASHDYFIDEVWPKVGAKSCLKCHKAGGDAEETKFILKDPARDASAERRDSTTHNREAFAKAAGLREEGESDWLVLLKVTDEIPHDGGDVLEPGSTQYRILEQFVRAEHGETMRPAAPGVADSNYDPAPFWEGITLLDQRRLLRRLTLSLAARLPTEAEMKAVDSGEPDALDSILDSIMTEDAFYDRLAEGFNDILLTRGYDGVAENALSYEHFTKTRHWTQKHDLSAAGDEDAQRKARYKLANDYREAMRREPTELIKYIVRNGRPFTEIITADYIMVSPYTSRGYGVFDQLKDEFENPDDPFEFVPVRLKALQNRNGRDHQESPTGFYPHAGVLSTFQYLKRYPTTETNRNRLRTRMYFQHFLGIDVMQLAPRVNDAAAITAKYEVPTMEASDCVVCHKTIDPIAGLFQDYYVVDGKGVFGLRKEGWFTDIFEAGFEGEKLPAEQRWRALQWLGERTVKDPRFAVAMVEHVFYILTGRRPLLPPEDLDDPLHAARQRAYRIQRDEIESIATRFAEADFDLKLAFTELAKSKFYQADGITSAIDNPQREAELADIGLVRLLSPEQLERKLAAIFGENWGRLEEQFKILYGGIDSKAVTERISAPSGAMGAIQRMMANHFACKFVGADFTTDPAKRRLFPGIEADVLPDGGAESERKIRSAIVFLHRQLLGAELASDDADIDLSYGLFAGVIADALSKGSYEKVESYFCRGADGERLDDPDYSIRAWRAVVAYLLRRQEFLYE